MPYSVFVSHAGCDLLVAEEVTRQINNAFRGDLHTYLAVRDLRPGDRWKSELLAKLRECDAILSIITDRSKSRPWILIEWGAFWLQDKTSYVCLDDDVDIGQLVHPMQDRQIARLRDVTSMRKFFEALAHDAGVLMVPHAAVEPMVSAVSAQLDQQAEDALIGSFSEYLNPETPLPEDDERLREIAGHFLACEDADSFVRVASAIRDELRLSELCRTAISKGEVDGAMRVADTIRSSERLYAIYEAVLDRGITEHYHILPKLNDLGRKSQTEVQRLAIRLVERGEEDTPLYRTMIEGMTNMAELRKVGAYLVSHGRVDGEALGQVINSLAEMNRAELRKVGSEFIQHGLTSSPAFQKLRTLLKARNSKESQKLEAELKASG